ncbi:hypothetical protein Moror_16798 [Moniliophthora roreri MCA 2997]|uniref:Uncharacterized protein n=1 Tax=Moniliophthora roreri (strain MCA 2997) TaxID=1381753 RepID=V2WSI5_MONRO|nr:hypothetical protein Moror_16798 [Moniliophthora roreri MCA 2997]
MEIANAQGVAISGNARFSVVHRDQYNRTTINNRIVHVGRPGRTIVKRERRKHDSETEYDQYHNIIRGDIRNLEKLCSVDEGELEWKDGKRVWVDSYRRTVHQAQLYGDDEVFTAFSYHGKDALKAWKKDFMKYSQADENMMFPQLFGINRSKVPALLFYDEWLPLGLRLATKDVLQFSPVSSMAEYANTSYRLWTRRTVPRPRIFFSKTGARNLDLDVLRYANRHACEKHTSRGPWLCSLSRARLEQIAISKQGLADPWKTWEPDTLLNKTLIESGLMRYEFKNISGSTHTLTIYMGPALRTVWLSQAHSLSEVSNGGSATYLIPHLWIEFDIQPQLDQSGAVVLDSPPTVYLFIRLPPSSLADLDPWMSQITFWSFGENGTNEIPETECKRIGLPNIVLWRVEVSLRTWPKHVYDAIHAWQVARGFDPMTADFARSLGFPIFEPIVKRDAQIEETIEEKEVALISDPLVAQKSPVEPNTGLAHSIHFRSNDLPANRQPSLLPTPSSTHIPRRMAPRPSLKRKRVEVISIHDTDSKSEPESSHRLSMPKQKRVKVVTIHDTDSESESELCRCSHIESSSSSPSDPKVGRCSCHIS